MLNEERTQFQKEQDELLKTVLNLRYFNPWSYDCWDGESMANDANIEIYITNACNLKCEYCYLNRFPELYPADKLDQDLILNNLRLFYDWLLKEDFTIPKIEFFSGEIWHTDFGLKILEITYEYLQKGLRVGWFMIPSNCTFVIYDKYLQAIQHYIDLFKEIGSPLTFSISIDGKIIEQTNRPHKDKNLIYTDEFYEMVFVFAKHNDYQFHPMFAASTMSLWIDNLKWWWEQFDKYDMDKWQLMTLEVRNDDWTEQYIKDYLEVLEFYTKTYLKEVHNNNVESFTRSVFDIHFLEPEKALSGYINWAFPYCDTFMGCTIATDFMVRLGDLAIIPCHRTAYDKYVYGYFVVKDNKIIDITANNPQMAIKTLMNNISIANPRCDQCLYDHFCMKGCCGAQIEVMGDPWIPIPSVCDMFSAKINWLLTFYDEIGVIKYLKSITPYEVEYTHVNTFLQLYDQWNKLRKEGKIDGLGKVQTDLSKRYISRRSG